MTGLLTAIFARGKPVFSEADSRDAAAISGLHGRSFRRGWSEEEIERLLAERNVVAHRAVIDRRLVGFILSRIAADEAEILSVAVVSSKRGRGVARQLLMLHLGRLAGLGVRVVFLEVDEHNISARKLYSRAGFQEVARRDNYYKDMDGNGVAALVLRRDLTAATGAGSPRFAR